MGITTQTLMKERFVLQKSFNEMNNKIQSIEKEVLQMKNNLNAVHGALQQVEKMIKYDAELGRDDGTHAKDPENKPALDIKPKEEAQLLNEKSK